MVLTFGSLADEETVPFIAGGDSGSVVLHNANEAMVLGPGFAGNSATSLSYTMPMEHIIHDIKTIIGAKVVILQACGTMEGQDLARRRVLKGYQENEHGGWGGEVTARIYRCYVHGILVTKVPFWTSCPMNNPGASIMIFFGRFLYYVTMYTSKPSMGIVILFPYAPVHHSHHV